MPKFLLPNEPVAAGNDITAPVRALRTKTRTPTMSMFHDLKNHNTHHTGSYPPRTNTKNMIASLKMKKHDSSYRTTGAPLGVQ